VTRKARRRERYAQDPDYRAKQRAQCRAYYDAHKEEINARSRAYYHAHKKDIQPLLRRGQLKRLYGISPAEYDVLLAKQGGVCAICGKASKKTLCVDHCHATGTIRGLLCGKCNTGFGCFTDSQAAMMAAIAYLGGSKDDRTGAAAKRALAARAVLPPGRADMTVRLEARSLNRLDADPAPAGDRDMRPMRNVLDAELRREDDDGKGGTANILQLIARKLAAKALAGDLEAIKEIFDRTDGKAAADADAPPGRVIVPWKGTE
jgi:Recombination endonuclease VII